MSNGHLSVQCIELLQREVQGPLGYVRVYVHGLLHTWGLVSVIECMESDRVVNPTEPQSKGI